MKTIFRWVMNPDNNPIMFAATILIVMVAFALSACGVS